MTNRIRIIITLLLFGIVPIQYLCADTHTETVNGRVLTENNHSSYYGTVYMYTLSDKMSLIDSIKQSKLPFGVSTKYPAWKNPLTIRQAFKDAELHALECFTKYSKGSSPSEYVLSVEILLNDNGEIICRSIRSSVNLLGIYSAKELISIFDEVGTFRFPSPVVSHPEIGYDMFNLSFSSIGEEDEDDEEDP